MNSTYKILTCI